MSVSFRQVGKGTDGKLCRGPNFDAFNRIAYPSIPTKQDQIIHNVPKSKGFGSHDDRFNYKPTRVLPGPGEYQNLQIKSTSFSSRGYGTFSSRQQRFNYSKITNENPGPGNYSFRAKSAQTAVKYNKKRSISLVQRGQMPAPGQYDPKHQEFAKIPMTSAFRGDSIRHPQVTNWGPPPGAYEVYGRKKGSNSGSAAFKMPVKARRYQVNLYDPHTQIPSQISPGPGEYQTDQALKEIQKTSHMFVSSDHDRFGRPVREKRVALNCPGPGAYVGSRQVEQEQTPSCSFLSETERRWLEVDRKPPGPAFYRPAPVPKKKSFHLNTKKLWMQIKI